MGDFLQLKPHPGFLPQSVEGVQVAIERISADTLWLRYRISGPLDDLVVPEPSDPLPCDNLWQSTCFEFFMRGRDGESYSEYNFAPSSRWAAYRFSSYRSESVSLPMTEVPRIELSAASDLLDVEVVLKLDQIEAGASLAISVVVEEASGTKSYWALAHPAEGPPDFHDPACFVLELPPAPAA